MSVKSWTEQITLPTYGIGIPGKNPVFLEKRVYQGSSGVVYPHPVIEKILDEKKDKTYLAVFLENDYIKVMLLPELGGRVQMAWDKSKQRHFVYYNQVIKPALVGLTGPWISGGIEFNWPQHHRPSTFEPTDFYIEEKADGSMTVWCNELERMFRTRGMAGLYSDSIRLLESGIEAQNNKTVYPMAYYYKAWAEMKAGLNDASVETLKEAAAASPDYCFPNQPEAVVVLEWSTNKNPKDFKAYYYLGNFWYAFKNYHAAISSWERSVEINDHFPTSHRNLALACFNKLNDKDRALQMLEKAFNLDPSDSRVFMELDQLYKRLNYTPGKRLEKMLSHQDMVNDRDDLYLEQVSLYNILGQHEKAYRLIMNRKFHPWEGGEGKVPGQYVYSLLELAKEAISLIDSEKAVGLLQKAQKYPDNLGEGKLYGAKENELLYR